MDFVFYELPNGTVVRRIYRTDGELRSILNDTASDHDAAEIQAQLDRRKEDLGYARRVKIRGFNWAHSFVFGFLKPATTPLEILSDLDAKEIESAYHRQMQKQQLADAILATQTPLKLRWEQQNLARIERERAAAAAAAAARREKIKTIRARRKQKLAPFVIETN